MTSPLLFPNTGIEGYKFPPKQRFVANHGFLLIALMK